jgi:hypothetical protein
MLHMCESAVQALAQLRGELPLPWEGQEAARTLSGLSMPGFQALQAALRLLVRSPSQRVGVRTFNRECSVILHRLLVPL